MKKSLLLIFSIMMLLDLSAQSKIGIEHYFSYSSSVPQLGNSTLLYLQSPGNWHVEIRNNYDEPGAVSINAGRLFSFGDKTTISVKPMLGLVLGSFTGMSFNVDHEIEWRRLYGSSKIQWMFSFRNASQNFLYAWIETGYCFSEKIFAGISLQGNLAIPPARYFSKGFVIGFSSGRWTVPVYFFDPLSRDKNIITGVIYNMNF